MLLLSGVIFISLNILIEASVSPPICIVGGGVGGLVCAAKISIGSPGQHQIKNIFEGDPTKN